MVEAWPPPAAQEQEPCAHHWLIENPNGETSIGVCKYCGASREFRNYAAPGQYQHRTRKDATQTQ
ncbi:MAG: hypothetical protein HYS09_02885 [Chloroflexi bacterium]|nr:hypothetical protein [Chloroflexota bacterium]